MAAIISAGRPRTGGVFESSPPTHRTGSRPIAHHQISKRGPRIHGMPKTCSGAMESAPALVEQAPPPYDCAMATRRSAKSRPKYPTKNQAEAAHLPTEPSGKLPVAIGRKVAKATTHAPVAGPPPTDALPRAFPDTPQDAWRNDCRAIPLPAPRRNPGARGGTKLNTSGASLEYIYKNASRGVVPHAMLQGTAHGGRIFHPEVKIWPKGGGCKFSPRGENFDHHG